VAVRRGSTLNYLLTDHLGSTSRTIDSLSARVLTEVRYRAWGEERYSSGAPPTSLRFTGQRAETGLGLYFYKARYMDHVLGRFTSPDSIVPIASQGVQAWDRYAYVNNNPVKYTDPSGHDAGCNGKDCADIGLVSSAVEFRYTGTGSHSSLGTQINRNTVLTHNHNQTPYSSLVAYDSSGKSHNLDSTAKYSQIGPSVFGGKPETTLLTFSQQLGGNGASIASIETILNLEVGDIVKVIYWTENLSSPDIASFDVIDVSQSKEGGISLKDPKGIINPGDSGGGVFFNNQLIGNTWAIEPGMVHIALVPQISNDSKATTPILVPPLKYLK
jgi:RHS repeat-associated protein